MEPINDNFRDDDGALLAKARIMLKQCAPNHNQCSLTNGSGKCPLLSGMLRNMTPENLIPNNFIE